MHAMDHPSRCGGLGWPHGAHGECVPKMVADIERLGEDVIRYLWGHRHKTDKAAQNPDESKLFLRYEVCNYFQQAADNGTGTLTRFDHQSTR